MEHVRLEERKNLVIGNKVFKSFNDWELTDKDREKALRELGENEEEKKLCLRELKEKLLRDDDIRYCSDDTYLLRFLRVRKYNVQKAYGNLKELYKLRKQLPVGFEVPPDLKSLLDMNIVRYLPYVDEEGRVLFWVCAGNWDPEEVSFDQLFPVFSAVGDISTMNPGCQINGVFGIWDVSGLTVKHFTHLLTNKNILLYLKLFLNGFSYRISKIIIINTNRIAKALFTISRAFISRKVAERIVMIGSDLNELHQHVNPAILPKNLGGSLEEEECSITQQILDNLPYLLYERSYI